MTPQSNSSPEMPWTGERYVPGLEGDIRLEHLHRYLIACDLARGKEVLDIACGEGYGADLLAGVASHVTGVDISKDTVAHAMSRYPRKNLTFTLGTCSRIPLPDASVDVVVSFETIEHHNEHERMMREFRRVLRSGGIAIISTPDRFEYSDVLGQKNPFHVKELYREEFEKLLRSAFKHVAIYGQRVHFGSYIAPAGDYGAQKYVTFKSSEGELSRHDGMARPLYLLGLVSNDPLPPLIVGLFEGQDILAEKDGTFKKLNDEFQSLVVEFVERQQEVESLAARLAESNQQVNSLVAQVVERQQEVERLILEASEKDKSVQSLTKQLTRTRDPLLPLTALVGEPQLDPNAIYSSRLWKLGTAHRSIYEPLRAQIRRLVTSRLPHWLAAVRGRKTTAPTALPAPLSTEIVATHKLDVFCFPRWDWNSRHEYPRQLLTQFAADGHRVFYLSPQFAGVARPEMQARPLSDRVYELRFSGHNRIFRDGPERAMEDKSLDALCAFIRQQNIAEAICWLQDPAWEPLARELKARYGWKTIYDCGDERVGFTLTPEPLGVREDALVRASDLAIATSQSRYERLRQRHVNCIPLSVSDDEASPSVWKRQYQDLIPAVRKLYGKASIVVVTWDNLDLTRQCLESVLADTTWPQYDVIVVDNASSDGTADYLTVLAQNEPRLRVILNPTNAGFAAANNIGFHCLQDSEYVVLLNNDTVVPPGWLARLLRHARKHEIGLVGPVTNWTGNEAKIDVTYTDLRAMESFAAGYIANHEGEVFDIRVMAMYCVALRKSVLDEVGLLDERFRVGMFEDDDYARRVRQAGYRVVCAEDVFVHHYGNASFSKLSAEEYQGIFERNKRLYEDKWGGPWVPHQNRADAKRR